MDKEKIRELTKEKITAQKFIENENNYGANKILKIIKIIAMAFVCIGLTSGIVVAVKDIINYDEQGRVMVYVGEKKPDVPNEVQTVLIIPEELEEQQKIKEKSIEEKKKFEEGQKNSNIVNMENTITQEEKDYIDGMISESKKIEENAIIILKKYYGNTEIEELFKDLREKMRGVSGSLINDYAIPESGIQILNMAMDLLESEYVTLVEKEELKKYMQTIEIKGIKDDEVLKEKIQNL